MTRAYSWFWGFVSLAQFFSSRPCARVLAIDEDASSNVRDRAGCNLSDCGNFTRAQRMRMAPKFLELAARPGTNAQMRGWSYLALREITDANVPSDPQAWKNWYRDHGAEKLAEFQRLDWWRVRGDEWKSGLPRRGASGSSFFRRENALNLQNVIDVVPRYHERDAFEAFFAAFRMYAIALPLFRRK